MRNRKVITIKGKILIMSTLSIEYCNILVRISVTSPVILQPLFSSIYEGSCGWLSNVFYPCQRLKNICQSPAYHLVRPSYLPHPHPPLTSYHHLSSFFLSHLHCLSSSYSSRHGHGFAQVFPEHKYLIVECLRQVTPAPL